MPRKGENIYKRKDGRWELRIISSYDNSGHAHYKSYYAHSYMEAKKKKAELGMRKEHTDKKSDPADDRFEILCLCWLQSIKPVIKESSYVRYMSSLRCHIIPALGDYRIQMLSDQVMKDFFSGLLSDGSVSGKGLSTKSAVDIKSMLKQILLYAQDSGFCVSCHIDHIQIKQQPKRICVLSYENQEMLEDYLLQEGSFVCLGIYVCLYSGLRIGEICALCWEDVDLEAGVLSVRKTMQRIMDVEGTSGKKTKIIITSPKSFSSVRNIPLPGCLLKKLKVRRQGIPDGAYFLTGSAEKYMEPRCLEYHFKKALRKCGITDMNFHVLRHTFATRCVELNFDSKTLSEILGHANVMITMNRYVHPSMELKRTNMDKLGTLSSVRKLGQRKQES